MNKPNKTHLIHLKKEMCQKLKVPISSIDWIRISIDKSVFFHSLWCSADLALHGWLTGSKTLRAGVDVSAALVVLKRQIIE